MRHVGNSLTADFRRHGLGEAPDDWLALESLPRLGAGTADTVTAKRLALETMKNSVVGQGTGMA